MTTPAPSLPTGMGMSTRAAMACSTFAVMGAVTVGWLPVPETLALFQSAAPRSNPKSDGLMGAASMRTSTSSGPGEGSVTVARDSSISPFFLTVECSCREDRPVFAFMSGSCIDEVGRLSGAHDSTARQAPAAARLENSHRNPAAQSLTELLAALQRPFIDLFWLQNLLRRLRMRADDIGVGYRLEPPSGSNAVNLLRRVTPIAAGAYQDNIRS